MTSMRLHQQVAVPQRLVVDRLSRAMGLYGTGLVYWFSIGCPGAVRAPRYRV